MKRDLTPEEEMLWKQVMAKTTPLVKRDVGMWRCGDVGKRKITSAKTEKLPKEANLHISASPHPHLPAGIDRNTAERFRKGKLPIDAALDLHGLTHDAAQAACYRFLERHSGRGSRCLLIITGKGLVLRESLPRWLAGLQPIVLAFDRAQPKHGGSGAYYVLLKRKRHARC